MSNQPEEEEQLEFIDIPKAAKKIPKITSEYEIRLEAMFLVKILIGVLCFVLLSLLAYYFFGAIKLQHLEDLFGEDPKAIIEAYTNLRNQRIEDIARIAQFLLASILVPVITLFAGYVFGKAKSE